MPNYFHVEISLIICVCAKIRLNYFRASLTPWYPHPYAPGSVPIKKYKLKTDKPPEVAPVSTFVNKSL